jgi:thiol-disulfide isomerase/thioredoxin
LLIKDVVQSYNGRARFVSENWGDSKLAERYGVTKYPVVFVDDVLVAKPRDFGWNEKEKGKYTPLKERSNQERFKKDLSLMIDLALRDRNELSKQYQVQTSKDVDISSLPNFTLQNLEGRSIESAGLSGQVVVVEFWATWCPPCRSTLSWLGEVKRRYGDKVTVLTIALESDEAEVRKLTQKPDLQIQVAMGSDGIAERFGGLTSFPTMYVFDQNGKTASIFHGAPQDLHEKVNRLLDSLVK